MAAKCECVLWRDGEDEEDGEVNCAKMRARGKEDKEEGEDA